MLPLITGSECKLGVVTEITVRLLPTPSVARVILAAFDDLAVAGNGVAAIIAEGIIPAGLEMMDNPAIRAAEDFADAGYPRDAVALLLCELDGTDSEVNEGIRKVSQILKREGASEIRLAADEGERQRFWSGRKNAFPAVGRISPDYYCIDGTIPKKRLGEVLSLIHI